MKNEKTALIFPSFGLGDGLIFMTLAYNLTLNNFKVHVFHNGLLNLEKWFPHFHLHKIESWDPKNPEFGSSPLVLINKDSSSKNQQVCQHYLSNSAENVFLFAPSSRTRSETLGDHEVYINPNLDMISNLILFCKVILKLKVTERANGISPPSKLVKNKYPNRISIHPTSSSPKRNWPFSRFQKLSSSLKFHGFETFYTLSPSEQLDPKWNSIKHLCAPIESLESMASFIYESGYFVGNDSGLGHLASCLGIPTVTIFNCTKKVNLWKPSWKEGTFVAPPTWIPNFKGLRLRKELGLKFISVNRVTEKLLELVSSVKD